MNTKNTLLTIFSLFSITALLFTGCATNSSLDPAGVYANNAFLYNIDSSINTSYTIIDSFLKVELQNNDYIKSNSPAIFAGANILRKNTPIIIDNVKTARALYVSTLGTTNIDQNVTASNTLAFAVSALNTYSQFALHTNLPITSLIFNNN